MKIQTLTIVCLFLSFFSAARKSSSPFLKIAEQYLGIPYVENTLEQSGEEKLIINKKAVDCTTFVEYVLAEHLTNDSISFEERLQSIRYREGKIEGYASRLHYFSEGVQQAINNGFIIDITERNSDFKNQLNIYFMSSHPDLYPSLFKEEKELNEILRIEKALSGGEFYYLPKERLSTEGVEWIEEGDIIALVTSIDGLDVSHVGFAVYINNELRLLHASSKYRKVIVDCQSLKEYVMKKRSILGIRVFRVQL